MLVIIRVDSAKYKTKFYVKSTIHLEKYISDKQTEY